MKKKQSFKSILVHDPTIDSYTARQRFSNFKKNKLATINSLCPGHDVSISYSVDQFINLLTEVVETNDNGEYIYTGIRVYFACYMHSTSGNNSYENSENDRVRIPVNSAGKPIIGHLALIFVPTIQYGNIDTQDSDKYYVFTTDGKTHQKLDKDFTIWINEYGKPGGIYEKLSQDKVNLPNGETRSLWYCIDSLQKTYDDLVTNYSSGQTDAITAFFAAYPTASVPPKTYPFFFSRTKVLYKDVSSQLTIIFGTGPVPWQSRFKKNSLFRRLLRIAKTRLVRYDNTDYDTGAPCPPADGCTGGIYGSLNF